MVSAKERLQALTAQVSTNGKAKIEAKHADDVS